MIKAVEFIAVLVLLIFAFIAGVKYSDSIKVHASWLFEHKDEEVELPDLNESSGAELGTTVDENGESLSGPAETPDNQIPAPQDGTPMDDIGSAPKAAPITGTPKAIPNNKQQ